MNFKPILFSSPMVKAILDGKKTQTRRIIKKQPINQWAVDKYCEKGPGSVNSSDLTAADAELDEILENSKIQEGDVLWVRETFRKAHHYGIDYEFTQYKDLTTNTHCQILDKDQILHDDKWKPSIFMPKDSCRIFLLVTKVRIEKLHEISNEDARAEGIENHWFLKNEGYKHYTKPDRFIPFAEDNAARNSFFSLWMKINGAESLDANPWVYVYEFEQIKKPENF